MRFRDRHYAGRVIGSIRRKYVDQVSVFGEDHVRHYHRWRTHLSLAMDAPDRRPVQPLEQGAVNAVPEVGGSHHHYERSAA